MTCNEYFFYAGNFFLHGPRWASRLMCASLCAVVLFCSPGALGAEEVTEEETLVSNVRQITFAGRRSGEGYFSADGTKMVFQSEREGGNPFYQIYLLDLETGDIDRVSPGHGKTTCAWIHPDGKRVLFASTHEDPDAKTKQEQELEDRAAGTQRRYAWDYDEHFDLYVADLKTGSYTNLTKTLGYDAEGDYSPDGSLIVFASNRHAYTESLSEKDKAAFEVDKSLLMDIYIMDGDGGNVRRLTTHRGYDGGPFFNGDGTRICWRRFSEDGARAEIFTMNVDGSDERQLTELGAMSWAPYFHPSGEYLIFTTNIHGFDNFELYLVDVRGAREPVRVTYTGGFDGLPVFTPAGDRLAWTSTRTAQKQSQIFFGDWDHGEALARLNKSAARATEDGEAGRSKLLTSASLEPAIRAADMRAHVETLASEPMEGRLTGTGGSRLATAYVASVFNRIGLEPGGDRGTFFQEYDFTAGVSLGPNNVLAIEGDGGLTINEEWRPLAYSHSGDVDPSGVVFAGYGIVAPEADDISEYDSFVHLDVTDKWVMVFRYMPEDLSQEDRQHFSWYSNLRYKAMTVRDKGAKGLIVVSGPNSKVKEQLVSLSMDVSFAGSSVFAVSVTDAVAERLLAGSGKSLKSLQDALDGGEPQMGFELDGVRVSGRVDIQKVRKKGRNVVALLRAGEERAGAPVLVIGAHVDHLGRGASTSSLARDSEKGEIHFGADDNASGVAGVLEIAHQFAAKVAAGDWELTRDVVFAAWTGEELGRLGSDYFVNQIAAEVDDPNTIGGKVCAYLNMDMIGRIREKLIINGVGSSTVWPSEIERRNIPVGLPITTQNDSYLPTDATSFYLKGVPILNAFSGAHSEYHTPRDTADLINYEGAAKTAKLFGLIGRGLATGDEVPDYVAMTKPGEEGSRSGMRVYLGTIPDYADTDVAGVRLSGVTAKAPADLAGMKGGDVIVELAGRKIENIYDYTYALDALKVGEPASLTVLRDGKRLELRITPESRE